MSDLPLPDPMPASSPEQDAPDIQHDSEPEQEHGAARHIPHLGHCLLLFFMAFLLLQVMVLVFAGAAGLKTLDQFKAHAGILLGAQAAAFALTLLAAAPLFSRIWQLPFVQGIQWNGRALRRFWYWLLPAGVASSLLATGAEHFVTQPESSPLLHMMHTPAAAWGVLLYGTLLAPLTEEVAFRGFLFPALATTYDWLSLERTRTGLQQWNSSAEPSRPALVFSVVFTNIAFALLHSEQLSHAWGAVSVIFGVGVVLTLARILTRSTACSTLMHMVHNGTVFVYLLWETGGFRHLDRLT